MQLLPYPESHHIQVKLDWLELTCLSNIYFTTRISELRNTLENLDFFTSSDIGEEDAEVENEIQRLLEQYQQRRDILGESYPFVFNEETSCLELVRESLEQLTIDQHIYLYCLYFSHMSASRLFSGLDNPTNAQRDLLQVAATIALAGYSQGHSISFGWPRPDNSDFYAALTRTVDLIGEGRIKPFAEVNRYLQTRPHKDAGIDVIAWKDNNPRDIFPGNKLIYFAQVASGNNWRSKAVKEDIDVIQRHWLSQRIYRVIDAIVIPFDFESDDESIKRDHISLVAEEFGAVLHRLRLPTCFKKGLELLASNPELLIERGNEVHNISQYVISTTVTLQQEAA
ncbi:TPA: hypothetical protein SMF46_004461 [Serratia marcescens]|uniref:hypothetical protein n=1 Tax=Serratia marcescens TaxID=615 RepID=UPI00237F5F8C|nr:hypothetical protein [Serratia marcescens]EMB6256326.1 hypothetical protein [Serratia marcescens]BEM40498.1 hypothetical protein SME10J_42250 [Serratia marcescens]HEJ7002283.1 hypothetical protein [Serratia marcescens]